MKKSEIAMIILIAAGSIIVAYFVAHAIFGGAANQATSVPTIQAINVTFATPDPTVFNSNAINPTVNVTLSGSDSGSSDISSGQ